jgi:hypothetical protein
MLVSVPNTLAGQSGFAAQVLNPRLATDLRNGAHRQFPSAQTTLTASVVGANRIELSTTLNPSEPEKVSGGTYRGAIVLSSGSTSFAVPMVAYLSPREGTPAAFAFLLLFLGASLGLIVKWITEALSQLAAARWRFEDVRRSLGGASRTSLPTMASAKLEEIENRIRRQDTGSLDAAFAPLLANARQLSAFSAAVQSALREIEQQEGLAWGWNADDADPIDSEFVRSIIQAERNQIDRLRSEEWPLAGRGRHAHQGAGFR